MGPIDLHDTDAMLYQLSYEALLKAGQERVQFYTHYMKSEMMCIFNHVYALQIKNTVLHSCEAFIPLGLSFPLFIYSLIYTPNL